MTREEAIRILDPETALQELGRIAYYGGFKHEHAIQKAIDEAVKLAIEALKERPKGRCTYCKDGKTFVGQSIIFCNDNKFHKINFCPNCGADMRDGEEECI